MNAHWSRRRALVSVLRGCLGALALMVARGLRAATRKTLATESAPQGYDPYSHRWQMALDVDRCIGCGLCVDACKTENHVPQSDTCFRTWIERYIIKRPEPDSGEARGEVLVDAPHGGQHGFPPSGVPDEDVLKSFFVPKLCNLCEHSACVQACPVGATFDSPDGVALIDPTHCIGCGFCIQACPYGCRFLSPVTRTAEKCTLCYHRITRGLLPACVEVCPTEARVFGDLKDPNPDTPIRRFMRTHKVQSLKPHLGTGPRVVYAGLDKEVR
jgi:Fe-S-cluster-containing dehydrogenase component